MNKFLSGFVLCSIIVVSISLWTRSCNWGGITHVKFTHCQARFPDGTVKMFKVNKWMTLVDDSGCVQIETSDGAVYIFHANNAVLINNDKSLIEE